MKKPHRKNDRLRPAPGPDTDQATGAGGAPLRQCAATRERLPQTQMVRFVAAPDGTVAPDVLGKLPGRGVWVASTRPALELAVKSNAFARGLKTGVTVPDGLVDGVEAQLLQRCLGLLGMAKKGGDIVLGFDQVRAALESKAHIGWLLEASDGAEDGREKVYFLAKALYEDMNVAGALSAAELGMAFGRPRVIHGLVRKGGFSKAWSLAYRRLTGFREAPEQHWFSRMESR